VTKPTFICLSLPSYWSKSNPKSLHKTNSLWTNNCLVYRCRIFSRKRAKLFQLHRIIIRLCCYAEMVWSHIFPGIAE